MRVRLPMAASGALARGGRGSGRVWPFCGGGCSRSGGPLLLLACSDRNPFGVAGLSPPDPPPVRSLSLPLLHFLHLYPRPSPPTPHPVYQASGAIMIYDPNVRSQERDIELWHKAFIHPLNLADTQVAQLFTPAACPVHSLWPTQTVHTGSPSRSQQRWAFTDAWWRRLPHPIHPPPPPSPPPPTSALDSSPILRRPSLCIPSHPLASLNTPWHEACMKADHTGGHAGGGSCGACRRREEGGKGVLAV